MGEVHKDAVNFGLWELAVLSLLREQPMHPYEIQRLLKERKKGDVLVLKKGSLYHAIQRLTDAALIEVKETTREGLRPERTTYRITRAGKASLGEWLRRLLAVPEWERSHFMGAVSFLVHLAPREAIEALQLRVEALAGAISDLDASLESARSRIGRIHVVESEYARAMRAAELGWVRALLQDIQSGRLHWDIEAVLQMVRKPRAPTRKKAGK